MRPVEARDIDAICRHRERMFVESGHDVARVGRLAVSFRAWLEPRLGDGRYFGWAIECADAVVAGLGMMELDWPPHPLHPHDGRRGYVLNVYVEPEHRRKGLGRLLVGESEAEARRRGLAYVVLHATDEGRALYASLGWKSTGSEMSLSLASAGGAAGSGRGAA